MDSHLNSLKNERDKIKLSLRKDSFAQSLIKSRFSSLLSRNTNNKAFEIDITVLDTEKEIQDTFDKASIGDKVNIAFKEMNSLQSNHVMFGMKQIRNYTDTFEGNQLKDSNGNSNTSFITLEIFDRVFFYLTSKENLNLIYESSCIMINLTYSFPFFANKLSEKKYLSGIIGILLNQTPSQLIIKTQAQMIIGNILELNGNSFIQQLIQYIPFFEYITTLFHNIITQEATLPVYAMIVLLWNMGSYIKHSSDLEIVSISFMIMKIFPQLIKLISNNIIQELFEEGITCLYWIIDRMKSNAQIILIINKTELYSHLNSLISLKKLKRTKMILSMYINITLVSDDAIKLITEDHSLYSSIEKVLINYIEETRITKNKNKVLIQVYQLLNNCAAMSQECNVIIRKCTIVEYTMKIFEQNQSNSRLISEILVFFANAIDVNDSRIKMELIRFPLIEFAISQLNVTNNAVFDNIVNCLKIIEMYLSYGEMLMRNRNIIKEQTDIMNLYEVLLNLMSHNKYDSKDNIDKDIENLITKYFKKNNDN